MAFAPRASYIGNSQIMKVFSLEMCRPLCLSLELKIHTFEAQNINLSDGEDDLKRGYYNC